MKWQVRTIQYQKARSAFLETVVAVIESYNIPVTLRQVFYRLVAMKEVANTPNEYRRVGAMVRDGRYTGAIDWDRIVDDTRAPRKTNSWDSIDDLMQAAVDQFRFDRWRDSDQYVELWCEKRTLVRTLEPITDPADVNLVAGAGFNSTTAIWEAVGRLLPYRDRQIIVLYLGDLDPSGDDMDRDIPARLAEFGINVDFRRLLVTDDQIEQYGLSPAFAVPVLRRDQVTDKLRSDPRAQAFIDRHGALYQVEADAVDPAEVVRLVTEAVGDLQPETFEAILAEEEIERDRVRVLLLQP